jgi:hypothetical protein
MPLANNALRKAVAEPHIATRPSLLEINCAVEHGFGDANGQTGEGKSPGLPCREAAQFNHALQPTPESVSELP